MSRLAPLFCALALLVAGCGGDAELTVYAASSLTGVLDRLDESARFNFAGSDELATQIREGAKADVYAAASARHPRELYDEGLVRRPRVFATNTLVLVVPLADSTVRAVDDLARPGTRLVIGGPGVPAGDYARELLRELGQERVLENVVSEEDDVKGVLGKVALGEADAGFVYATDVASAAGDVRAVALAAPAAAAVHYLVAVVRDAEHPDEAERFVERLLGAEGRRVLREAGFGLP